MLERWKVNVATAEIFKNIYYFEFPMEVIMIRKLLSVIVWRCSTKSAGHLSHSYSHIFLSSYLRIHSERKWTISFLISCGARHISTRAFHFSRSAIRACDGRRGREAASDHRPNEEDRLQRGNGGSIVGVVVVFFCFAIDSETYCICKIVEGIWIRWNGEEAGTESWYLFIFGFTERKLATRCLAMVKS